MIPTDFTLITGKTIIHEWQKNLDVLTWPTFLLRDIQQAGSWSYVYEDFLTYQFAYFDGENLVGIGNSMGINFDEDFDKLPEKGLDWAAEKSKADKAAGLQPNLMVAIQIMLHPDYKNKGLSYMMVNTMKNIAYANGLSNIALPVRPNMKSHHPEMSIDAYINLTTDDGLPFDPWIRVHTKLGAKLIHPCHQSMYVSGSVQDWTDWTGRSFVHSGKYAVEGALMPINIDVDKNFGEYVEPNVWMVHAV
jgi:GNAT superfamily N-acetyltransferase